MYATLSFVFNCHTVGITKTTTTAVLNEHSKQWPGLALRGMRPCSCRSTML
jgi:hypothetical protein